MSEERTACIEVKGKRGGEGNFSFTSICAIFFGSVKTAVFGSVFGSV
jgi:hypothetical protein